MSERRYDPELAPFIPALPVETDWSDMQAARAGMAELIRQASAGASAPERVAFEDRTIPGRPGDPDVTVRVYTPRGEARPMPAVLYIHGGGFCVGSVETEHLGAAQAADRAGAVVLGIDVDRVAVMGGSAGGGLAAGIALMARDRKGPKLCFQVLNIPELDDRLETPSMKAFTDTPLWNRPNAMLSWGNYLGDAVGGRVSPYAAPARAEDLAGLPPAYVSTMEYDPLRDEGLIYGLRMLQQGVSVEIHQYPGTFHGSSMITSAAVSRRSADEMFDALIRGLRK